MCGIMGYIGDSDCAPILLQGLERLEYRGYDSAGLAIWSEGELQIQRAVGKLINLRRTVQEAPIKGVLGIGHTRWATHGRPNEVNAHPHRYGDVVVVHNGIIENHNALRIELEAKGHVFSSETDTEILAHLIHDTYKTSGDLVLAVREAIALVDGSYALVVLHKAHSDRMVVARKMSPLLLGIGDQENLVASDIPAVLSITRDILFLEDDEVALITRGGFKLYEAQTGKELHRDPVRVSWTPAMAEKGGYKHFMLKEIFEQPRALGDTIRSRILLKEADVAMGGTGLDYEKFKSISQIQFIACGTSYHAGLLGKYLVESIAKVPAKVEIGSEFRYRNPLHAPGSCAVAISQSGETADTIAAVKTAKANGAMLLSICNALDSSLPRMSDGVLYTHAGPEIGVASTKAFTTQLAAVFMLALWLGRRKGTLNEADVRKHLDELMHVPKLMEEALQWSDHIREVARKFQHSTNMLFLGRNLGFPIALEGALKLKEISYIHAEGYPAGEMKHGPIALVEESLPTVVIVPQDGSISYDKTRSNMQEIKARGGPVIAVTTEGDEQVASVADYILPIPKCPEALLPMITVIPLQLFSYHMADLRGTDVDQPRNLAKSVTVE
jgi:glutamine---fructose-6-phosphate transaminase (isomerizing)